MVILIPLQFSSVTIEKTGVMAGKVINESIFFFFLFQKVCDKVLAELDENAGLKAGTLVVPRHSPVELGTMGIMYLGTFYTDVVCCVLCSDALLKQVHSSRINF